MSVLQTVQKEQQTIYIWTDSAKRTTNNLHMDRQCKKNCTGAFTVLQTVQNNNNNNLHMDRQCKKTTNNLHMDRQCKKNNKQFTYGQTVQKNNKQFTYGQTVQKNNKQFTYGQTVQKKLHWSIYSAPDSAKKTTTIYIWTVHVHNFIM